MCGRAVQKPTWEELHKLLKILEQGDFSNLEPNWNLAPTDKTYVCIEHDGERQLRTMRWWLVPVWAKEKPKYPTFNAKVETIEEKPTWKGSLDKGRCVIPVAGFYEWRSEEGVKQPYYITRRDGDPLLLAGLWAINSRVKMDEGPDALVSCTILTCPANDDMVILHKRMPVILERDQIDTWLTPGKWDEQHRALTVPSANGVITAVPVSRDVGNVKNNRDDLISPIGDPIF